MNRFARAAARLRRRGVTPATTALGGATAHYTTVTGFNWRHLVAAFGAGVLACSGASGLVLAESNLWIGNRTDHEIVEGVKRAGVDIGSLSSSDIRARLSYSPDQGRMLVEVFDSGNGPLVNDLGHWLRAIERGQRGSAAQTLLKLSSETLNDPGRFRLVQAILDIDEAAASSLVDSTDVAQLLRKLAAIPFGIRSALVDADFPVRPLDDVRAHLWAMINDRNFPASDLVPYLAELARVHSTRLDEIRRYVSEGMPLPKCQAVACMPVACELNWSRGYTCEFGKYLTEGRPVCVPDLRNQNLKPSR